jgi:two-component system response regulator TctD
MRILLVEDTKDVGEAIMDRFVRLGHAVDWEIDGEAAAEILTYTIYDLIILDVMLPGKDGFSILQQLRRAKSSVPVLVLTARSEIQDRVGALDLGADDYLVKPFDFRELEARARALLRRVQSGTPNLLRCGDIEIDRNARVVRIGSLEVRLKRRELTLLEVFAAHPGQIFSKSDLLDRLFGFEEAAAPNAIELYIGRLRRSIAGSRVQIVTQRGLGYQMVIDPDGAGA